MQIKAVFSGSCLSGEGVQSKETTFAMTKAIYADTSSSLPPSTLMYRVDAHMPVPAGTEGGLSFGISHLMPVMVGSEYCMTKGHFHAIGNRGEYYWGIAGKGLLLLMDRSRHCWVEDVFPGSLHYIPGETAHRLVNTGSGTLSVGACWNSDAGYDYGTILKEGFSLGVFCQNGVPVIKKI